MRPPPAQAYYGQPAGYGAAPTGAYVAPGRSGGGYGGYSSDLVSLPSLSFMDTGARIKIMRHLQASTCIALFCG